LPEYKVSIYLKYAKLELPVLERAKMVMRNAPSVAKIDFAQPARTRRTDPLKLLTGQVGHRIAREGREGEPRNLAVRTAVEVALRIDLVEGRHTVAEVVDIAGLVEVLHTGREAGRHTAAAAEEHRMGAVGRTVAVVGRRMEVVAHTAVAVEVHRNLV
jgi:hypothetical protein